MWNVYLIGLVVAVVISIAALGKDWKNGKATRGDLAIIISIALSSWFAVGIISAIAISESEWGQQLLFDNTKSDEKADNKD
jgi:hypothetical protein